MDDGSTLQKYSRPITNGVSIYEQGVVQSGTLGGCLKDKSKGLMYGITCGHVLKNLKKPTKSNVVQPSDEDYHKFIKMMQSDIERFPLDKELVIELQELMTKDRVIGQIECSFLRWPNNPWTEGKIREDWAIFKVNQQTIFRNQNYPKGSLGRPGDLQDIDFNFPKNIHEIDTEMKLAKYGRTTGKTICGRFNGIESNVKYEGDPFCSDELAIISTGNKTFADDGDSGAWVVGRDQKLKGIIHGGNGSTITYCTPIGLVLNWVKKDTGIELVLP